MENREKPKTPKWNGILYHGITKLITALIATPEMIVYILIALGVLYFYFFL
jgi:hypothetical protein